MNKPPDESEKKKENVKPELEKKKTLIMEFLKAGGDIMKPEEIK